jgi:hypothetical protein
MPACPGGVISSEADAVAAELRDLQLAALAIQQLYFAKD